MVSTPAALAPADTVLGQIQRQTSDPFLRLAMATGAGLEGGNIGRGPWGVGDGGNSFGPFQINLPFHPTMNQASATNPHDAVAYMLGSYRAAMAQVSAALWGSNPERAAEQTAFIAERPAQDYYVARGASTVHSAYQSAVAGLGGMPGAIGNINGDPGTIAGLAGGTGAAGIAGDSSSGSSWTDLLPWNWAKGISGSMSGVVNVVLAFVMKMGFIGAGLVLVVLGAYRASGPAREKVGQGAAAAAAVA